MSSDSEEEWEEVDMQRSLEISVPAKKQKLDKQTLGLIYKANLIAQLSRLYLKNNFSKSNPTSSSLVSRCPDFIKRNFIPNLKYLGLLTNWWRNTFGLRIGQCELSKVEIELAITNLNAYEEVYVLLFCSLVRRFGYECRLVSSLCDPSSVEQNRKENFNYFATNWIEVKIDTKWNSVDPISGKINDQSGFHSPLSSEYATYYVVGISESDLLKDVTMRYTKKFGSKVLKKRKHKEWWNNLIDKRSQADENEDKELLDYQMSEPLPKSLNGFVAHPLFALESQLHQNQIIYPKDRILGTFKGNPVYPRSQVRELLSESAWLKKKGRVIAENETPLKQLKGKDLFGVWQTKLFVAPLAINGKVPRNSYGNIELFHKNMLPKNCRYLSLAKAIQACKLLGVDYAEAVTEFVYSKESTMPQISGIVICEESEEAVLEVCNQLSVIEEETRRQRLKVKAKKLWINFTRKLLLINDIEETYAKE